MPPTPRRKRSKYGNVKATFDGHRFDSQLEMRRYMWLKHLERGGEITNLVVHPKFDLIVNGQKVGSYSSDMQYDVSGTGDTIVEDCKSAPTRTTSYRLKKRLMKALLGITVQEIQRPAQPITSL